MHKVLSGSSLQGLHYTHSVLCDDEMNVKYAGAEIELQPVVAHYSVHSYFHLFIVHVTFFSLVFFFSLLQSKFQRTVERSKWLVVLNIKLGVCLSFSFV